MNEMPLSSFSPKERTILRLVSLGRSNQEIAREMGLAETTIRRHYLSKIYNKFGITGNVKTGKRFKLIVKVLKLHNIDMA